MTRPLTLIIVASLSHSRWWHPRCLLGKPPRARPATAARHAWTALRPNRELSLATHCLDKRIVRSERRLGPRAGCISSSLKRRSASKDTGRSLWYLIKVSMEKSLSHVEYDADEEEVFLQALLCSPEAHAVVPFGTAREDFTHEQYLAWKDFLQDCQAKARAMAAQLSDKSLDEKVEAVEDIVKDSPVDFFFPHRDG